MTALSTRDALTVALREWFPMGSARVADALLASGAVIDAATLADDVELIEVARRSIEDELIEWRDARRSMLCGNGFTVHEEDGSPSPIIRFRTDIGFRIGLRALVAALTERSTSS